VTRVTPRWSDVDLHVVCKLVDIQTSPLDDTYHIGLYIRKRSVPKTDPWGTSNFVPDMVECSP